MKTKVQSKIMTITAVEDFSERAVVVTALVSMSKEEVHAHLSEMRDHNDTETEKKKNPVVVSDLFRLAVFFLQTLFSLKPRLTKEFWFQVNTDCSERSHCSQF